MSAPDAIVWGTFCNSVPQYGLSFYCSAPSAASLCAAALKGYPPVKCTTNSTVSYCTNGNRCIGNNYTDDFYIEYSFGVKEARVFDNFQIHGSVYNTSYTLSFGDEPNRVAEADVTPSRKLLRAVPLAQRVIQSFKDAFSSSKPLNAARDLIDGAFKSVKPASPAKLGEYENIFLASVNKGVPQLVKEMQTCQNITSVKEIIQEIDTLTIDNLFSKKLAGTTHAAWLLSVTSSHIAAGSALEAVISIVERLLSGPQGTNSCATSTTGTSALPSQTKSSTTKKPTSKHTSTAKSSKTSKSTKSSTSPPTSTATYQPPIPSSYETCLLDPQASGDNNVYLLETNSGLPIINNDGHAMVLQSVNTEASTLYFQAVPAAPKGVYDLVLNNTGQVLYLAVFQDGEVGFVSQSSKGQTFRAGSGSSFVTTIWSLNCEGEATAGIVGGQQYDFVLSNGSVMTTASKTDKVRTREITISPMRWFVYSIKYGPLKGPVLAAIAGDNSPQPRCIDGTRTSTVKPDARAAFSNGCGNTRFHADFNLKPCCDAHDYCYDNCATSWEKCNSMFAKCVERKCATDFPGNPLLRFGCLDIARFFTSIVVSNIGRYQFDNATADRCECDCGPSTVLAPGKSTPPCDNPNLLKNGNFEAVDTSDNPILDPWLVESYPQTSVTPQLTPNNTFDGLQSMVMSAGPNLYHQADQYIEASFPGSQRMSFFATLAYNVTKFTGPGKCDLSYTLYGYYTSHAGKDIEISGITSRYQRIGATLVLEAEDYDDLYNPRLTLSLDCEGGPKAEVYVDSLLLSRS